MRVSRVEVTEDERGVRIVGTFLSGTGRKVRKVLAVVPSRADVAEALAGVLPTQVSTGQ